MKNRSAHGAGFFKRMLSMLLVIVLMFSDAGIGSFAVVSEYSDPAASEASESLTEQQNTEAESQKADPVDQPAPYAEGDTTDDSTWYYTDINFSGYQTKGLDIYNHLHFTDANGAVTPSGGRYRITGHNTNEEKLPVVIGNHPGSQTSTSPTDAHIEIDLVDFSMNGAMTIYPVGTSLSSVDPGRYGHKVVLMVHSIADESSSGEYKDNPVSLGSLVLEDNATLELSVGNQNVTIDSITLGKNSWLQLHGTGSVTVNDGITLGENSLLEVLASSANTEDFALKVTGNISGKTTDGAPANEGNEGNVQFSNVTVETQGISAKILGVSHTALDAKNGAVTATDSLSMRKNSSVTNVSLFGYVGESGKKTLSFEGSNSFTNVTAVGCDPQSKLLLTVESDANSFSLTNSTLYQDYTITYNALPDGARYEEGTTSPTAYRVSMTASDLSGAKLHGYHTNDGYTSVDTNEIPLPNVTPADGYGFTGWTAVGTVGTAPTQPIRTLDTVLGNITLTAQQTSGSVTLKLDRGYEPNQYTNEKDSGGAYPVRITTQTAAMGETLSLPIPTRLCYTFKGWQVLDKDGNVKRLIEYKETSGSGGLSYTVDANDCIPVPDSADTFTLPLVAKWEPMNQFRLSLILGLSSTVSDDKLMVSIDGGNTFQNFTQFADYVDGLNSSKVAVNRSERTITLTGIAYGQTLGEILLAAFPGKSDGGLPVLKDDRIATSVGEKRSFSGWRSELTGMISNGSEARFLYGDGGILSPKEDETLLQLQDKLLRSTTAVIGEWGGMCYPLQVTWKSLNGNTEKVDTTHLPSGWTLTYTDKDRIEHTIDGDAEKDVDRTIPAEGIQVLENTTVILKTDANAPSNFSLWSFKTAPDPRSGKDPEKIYPQEKPYKEGNSEIKYEFTMPSMAVDALYNDADVWINIARSPILFTENAEYNNRTLKGFWYSREIDDMTPLFWSGKNTSDPRHDEKYQKQEQKLSGMDDTLAPAEDLSNEPAYFYQWDFEKRFCVTSEDPEPEPDQEAEALPTRNQLTLVNALTKGVMFRNLHLAMREIYLNNTHGSLIGGVDCETTNDDPITAAQLGTNAEHLDLADYANIIIDNNTKQAYATTLTFVGQNNTVGAIMPDVLRPNDNYKNTLNILGEGKDNSTLNLGTALGNFVYTVKNLTVKQYRKSDPQYGDATASQPEDLKYLIHSSNWTCTVTSAVIEAKDKVLHTGNQSFSFSSCTVDLKSINSYSGATLYNTYLRIRDNLLLGYVPLKLNTNSKAVIDGNLEMNYQHWSTSGDITDSTDNWLIVKGNRCDLTNLKWTSGTLICNAVIFGRCGGITGGTVITNQILNQPVGFWKYNKDTHEYNHAAESGQSEKVTASNTNDQQYEDDYPFLTYSQKRDGVDTFAFTGGKIFLLGYYDLDTDGKYDSNVRADDAANNPVAPFMAEVLDAATGGLRDGITSADVNTEAVKQAVAASTNKDKECVVLGNSTYNTGVRSRTIEIGGDVELYAAGNVTFFNDTNVKGGTIVCNGNFGTKGDLKITAGNITANTVGNAYNLKTTLADNTVRWRLTEISGGTINASRIGAFAKYGDSTVEPKSTITISGGTITGIPDLVHDVYVNYIGGGGILACPNNSPETIRFTVTWDGSKKFGKQSWKNTLEKFSDPPAMEAFGENVEGNWKWDTLTGPYVDSVPEDGVPEFGSVDLSTTAFDRIQMKLYAVKVYYNLKFMLGPGQVNSGTSDGSELEMPVQNEGDTRQAAADKPVKLVFDNLSGGKKPRNYTVLWYIDGNSIIHNVPDLNWTDDNTVTFKMPPSDVEVYCTNELPLDLDTASYTLMEDGFWTEYGKADGDGQKDGDTAALSSADRSFHYWGNLLIRQGSIKEMSFTVQNITVTSSRPEGGTKTLKNDNTVTDNDKAVGTMHKILVKEDFDSGALNRTVTLRHIYQYGESHYTGICLEKGAKADFILDGPIHICRVQVPAGADFSLTGAHNQDTDAFFPFVVGTEGTRNNVCLGNYYGAAGNITLKDLTILGIENGTSHGFCSGGGTGADDLKITETGANTVTYSNCKYQTTKQWYSGARLANNAARVVIDQNCDFDIDRAAEWPSPFFSKCGTVAIQGGSDITVTGDGSSKAATEPFYYGITEQLVVDGATVDLSMREPDGNNYLMFQDVKGIAPLVSVTNGGTLILDRHARLNRLVIGGMSPAQHSGLMALLLGSGEEASTVQVGQNGDGYLVCPDIEVNDGGSLSAGGLIVAGFYDASHAGAKPENELQKEENFQTEMASWVAGKIKHTDSGRVLDGDRYNGYNGLVVTGGVVNASEYITGDVNGQVHVRGGTVTSPVIGTTGKLYGFTKYVPDSSNPKYIYIYDYTDEKKWIPDMGEAMSIDISGGVVDVSDYLGGIRAEVAIGGGEVQLGENAVLGLTDNQKEVMSTCFNFHKVPETDRGLFGKVEITGGKVEGAYDSENPQSGGSINLPYGELKISGAETSINVFDMNVENGTITVSGATSTSYDNPYKTGPNKQVAIIVAGSLQAYRLSLDSGSTMYANDIAVNILNIELGTDTNVYANKTTVSDETGSEYEEEGVRQDLFTTKRVLVSYILYPTNNEGEPLNVLDSGKPVFLDDDDVDRLIPKKTDDQTEEDYANLLAKINPNLNKENGLTEYITGEFGKEPYELQKAKCIGYEFLGWYLFDKDKGEFLSDQETTEIDGRMTKSFCLAAKWKRAMIRFEFWVQTTIDDVDSERMVPVSQEDIEAHGVREPDEGQKWYRYIDPSGNPDCVSIEYGDKVLGDAGNQQHFSGSDYFTMTKKPKFFYYRAKQADDILARVDSLSTVSLPMATESVKKGGYAVLTAENLDSIRLRLTLHQNKQEKDGRSLPEDTRFNWNEEYTGDLFENNSQTGKTIRLYADIGEKGTTQYTLADSHVLMRNGELIKPTATGYTFGGWYADEACTKQVTKNTTIEELIAHKGNLYAKWTPNTYLVRFVATPEDEAADAWTQEQWVTARDVDTPADDSPDELYYYWVYDTAPIENAQPVVPPSGDGTGTDTDTPSTEAGTDTDTPSTEAGTDTGTPSTEAGTDTGTPSTEGEGGTAPAEDETKTGLPDTWKYGFWQASLGTNISRKEHAESDLPLAWRDGYTFDSWSFYYPSIKDTTSGDKETDPSTEDTTTDPKDEETESTVEGTESGGEETNPSGEGTGTGGTESGGEATTPEKTESKKYEVTNQHALNNTPTDSATSQAELFKMLTLAVDNYVTSENSYDPNYPETAMPALTLYANYHEVKVTYQLDGGRWSATDLEAWKKKQGTDGMSEDNSVHPKATGETLVGYWNTSDSELEGLSKLTPKSDKTPEGQYDYTLTGSSDNDTKDPDYFVIGTGSKYFGEHSEDENPYVPGDYREVLSKKGYTFQGWNKVEEVVLREGDEGYDPDHPEKVVEQVSEESKTVFIGRAPRFNDLVLRANWTPNTYTLQVHQKDENYKEEGSSDYKYEVDFNTPITPVKTDVTIENVTVGAPITANGTWPSGDEKAKNVWPARDDWYVYNEKQEADTNNYRYLLGATFASMDPGNSDERGTDPPSTYLRYAQALINLQNSDAVFNQNDQFLLPEDADYKAALGVDTPHAVKTTKDATVMSSVPDYPTGSEIHMYGVYRARSMVFIEEYVDDDNVIQSQIVYTAPWPEKLEAGDNVADWYAAYPYSTDASGYKDTDEKTADTEGYFNEGNGKVGYHGAGNYRMLTEEKRYKLMGWYVGSSVIDKARKYPENAGDFETKFYPQWSAALDPSSSTGGHGKVPDSDEDVTKYNINEYDINIYSSYVVHQSQTDTLNAVPDSVTNVPNPMMPTEVPLPLNSSIQAGALSYQITAVKTEGQESNVLPLDQLHLVSIDEMNKHLYDSEWTEDGITYTADNTIAIGLRMVSPQMISYPVDKDKYISLTNVNSEKTAPLNITETTADGQQYIGGGWAFYLQLYHSRVMTQDVSYSFDIHYHFEKGEVGADDKDVLANQGVDHHITVVLQPSRYQVDYRVKLPDGSAVTLPEDFAPPAGFSVESEGKAYHRVVPPERPVNPDPKKPEEFGEPYGSALTSATEIGIVPLEGYTLEGTSWYFDYAAEWPSDQAPPSDKTEITHLAVDTIPERGEDKLAIQGITALDRVENNPEMDQANRQAREAVLRDGKITVYTEYLPAIFTLTRDSSVIDGSWNITYDVAGQEEPVALAAGKDADVMYGYTVTLKDVALNRPLVLALENADGTIRTESLKDYVEEKGKHVEGTNVYTFPMPAKNVKIDTVWELYLDNGTIELYKKGFEQDSYYGKDKKLDWDGDYRILQCVGDNEDFHPTKVLGEDKHVLKVYGDLSTSVRKTDEGAPTQRQITLGRLNISQENSIELLQDPDTETNAQVTLTQTGQLQAKNILVPKGANLTLAGDANNTITLLPMQDYAAIGGSTSSGVPQNGTITLNDVNLSIKLPGSSEASGIGPAKRILDTKDSTNFSEPIIVKNSSVTVDGNGNTDQYTWIGGVDVSDVTIESTSLYRGSDEGNKDAFVVDGQTVTLAGDNTAKSVVGTAKDLVNEQIHADVTLKIEGYQVYQN